VASPARILRYRLPGDGPPEEFAYRVEPVEGAPPAGAFRVNGLSDLVALSADRLLALERQYVAGLGNGARLYLVTLAGATEVSGLEGLGRSGVAFAGKRRVADLGGLGFPLDNLEGMAFGPRLADGRRLLVLVSDDNFSPDQRTQVVAIAVDGL
jgi:3-phytase